MPIVAGYSRVTGDMTGVKPGPSGELQSTRQKLPYVSAPYASRRMFVETPPTPGQSVGPRVYNALYHDLNPTYVEREAIQLARLRLNRTLIKSRAALGITAATASQSFSMIATRANQIRKAWKAARKGNVNELSAVLGVKSRKSLKQRTVRDPSALWLEYTFGWVPLVDDMYQAAGVLTDPFEVRRSHGSATVEKQYRDRSPFDRVYVNKRTRAVCTAGLRVTNPNIALLTQLGLANPAAVAWDIIPFSFVVDWFVKINRFVNTWNDMAGFDYVDPVTTTNSLVNGLMEYREWTTGVWYSTTASGRSRIRTLEILNAPATPTIVLPTPNLWLASTSTALLVQVFGKK